MSRTVGYALLGGAALWTVKRGRDLSLKQRFERGDPTVTRLDLPDVPVFDWTSLANAMKLALAPTYGSDFSESQGVVPRAPASVLDRVTFFWEKQVIGYKYCAGDTDSKEDDLAKFGSFNARCPSSSTVNPWVHLERGIVAVKIRHGFGSTLHDLQSLETLSSGGATMAFEESELYWKAILDCATALNAEDALDEAGYNDLLGDPSFLSALGSAIKDAPRTVADAVTKTTAVVVNTAAQVGGTVAFGVLSGAGEALIQNPSLILIGAIGLYLVLK